MRLAPVSDMPLDARKNSMTSPPTGIAEYLDHCFAKFVQPLVEDLNLRVTNRVIDGIGGVYELEGDAIMLRLVNDRGLASLEVAPHSQPGDYWDLELMAGLFDPPPPRGVQRLNLEQQAELLRVHWSEINMRFGRVRYLFTRRTLEQLGHERATSLFGPGV